MNMGGAGLLLRTVARAVGPASGANPVITASGASTAICSACGSTRQTLRSCCNHVSLTHPGTSGGPPPPQQVDHDDWELADFSSNNHFTHDSPSPSADTDNPLLFTSGTCSWPNVFGKPPSFAEAEEATLELEAALSSVHMGSMSNSSSGLQCGSPANSNLYGNDSERVSNIGTVDWIEPRNMAEHYCITQTGRDPVHEAFRLLQIDPHVKGAVISVVSDPNVWNAMMKNKEVLQLRRLLEGTVKEESVSAEDGHPDGEDWFSVLLNNLYSTLGRTKHVAFKVKEVICRIFRMVYGVTSKAWQSVTNPSEKEDPVEKALRSSMVLAVLVFTIVIFKRIP